MEWFGNLDSKRIIFLTCNFPPVTGGIANYIYEIVRHIPANTTKVIGLPTSGSKTFDRCQAFSIERLGLPAHYASSRFFKFFAPVYLWYLLKNREKSVVLCDCAHHSLMFPAWCVGKICRIPFGIFSHGTDLLRPQGRKYRRFFNILLHSADVVFANSQKTADVLLHLGVRPDKIHMVWPSVNPQKFRSKLATKNVLQRHNLFGKKIILTVGRIVERKGIDTVINAMPAILKSVPEACYLIVGTGPYEDNLQRLICKLGLQRQVTFAGYVPDEELGAYYSACDLFVMVSRELSNKKDIEGFGIVYLEANLFGKPVVAGRSGGVSDAVLHKKTGLLVDPNCSREVAGSIVKLLTDTVLASQMGNAAKDMIMRDFVGAASANKVMDALSKIV